MFELIKTDGKARRGRLTLKRGTVDTPAFMPVATGATLKTLTMEHATALKAQILLANTYHLSLHDAPDIIHKAGGLHRFMNWHKPVLTDSGGFQIFSLKDLRKITPEGAVFRSHIDGRLMKFTPEHVTGYQEQLGSDIHMVLDECLESGVSFERTQKSLELSLQWAKRCRAARSDPTLMQFGIVQGGMYPELRQQSIDQLEELDFEGLAIGGLSVGESKQQLLDITALSADAMPKHKPRYLMGVGTPGDLVKAVKAGVDMFDCVMPTRNARNGTVFTSQGKINIRNSKHKFSDEPLDPECSCYTCQNHSKLYLRYLFQRGEVSAKVLLTIHNLHYYLELARKMQRAIENGTFHELEKLISTTFD